MGELALLDRELYTTQEAARILRMPPATLRWWLEGKGKHDPVLRTERTGSPNVTWGEFVEASCLGEYRRRKVPLQKLRLFITLLRDSFGVPYPLAHHQPFVGEGRRLLLEAQDAADLQGAPLVFEATGGQLVLDGAIEAFVERIDFAHANKRWAERIHPAGRQVAIVIDPEYSSGAPTVGGVRTEILAELVDAGEDLEEIADEYGLSVEDVKAATSYEWLPAVA